MAASPNVTLRRNDGVAIEVAQPASQPGDTFPAGATLMWPGASPPSGWIICDGSAVSRASYPTLFTNIGTTWGAGDGSTTFNIPDFRDRVPVGKSGSKALASTGGAETHTLTTAQMPSHNHGGGTDWQSNDHTHAWPPGGQFMIHGGGTGNASGKLWGSGSTAFDIGTVSTGGASANHYHTVFAEGGGTAHNNLQPYAAINYIIRAY